MKNCSLVYPRIKSKINMERTNASHRRKLIYFSATIILAILLSNIITIALALYIPDNQVLRFQVMSRRQDGDEEDLDRGASAPYQDQGDGQKANDGYEDGEPDGPYDETPREEEGQADLERFFDDHLGASEKDGMDQENLPTNLRPIIVASTKNSPDLRAVPSEIDFNTIQLTPTFSGSASNPNSNYVDNVYLNTNSQQYQAPLSNVETSFVQLPNQKLIVTRQITRGPVYKGGLDLSHVPAILKYHQYNDNFGDKPKKENRLQATSSHIVETENDDMDPVYVTNQPNKPFKIPDLGGYDPEEDFKHASRDFEESERRPSSRRKSSDESQESEARIDNDENNASGSNNHDQEYQPTKDISFNDEEDTLFNDASETDEVFFANDPYQTDLEAELKGEQLPPGRQKQESSDEGRSSGNEDDTSVENEQPQASNNKANKQISRGPSAPLPNEDDSEGKWINDGVEDMDVPSQAYQDEVLEKAAAAQEAAALALKNTRDGSNNEGPSDDQLTPTTDNQREQEQQQEQDDTSNKNSENSQNQDPDVQRMPNADYLREDMNVDELNDVAR